MAGHTKAFDYPVMGHWGKAEVFSSAEWDSNQQRIGQSRTHYQLSQPVPALETQFLNYILTLKGTIKYLSNSLSIDIKRAFHKII